MAQTLRRAALVGLALLVWVGPARAGLISVILSAGSDGSSTPTASGSFQFTSPTDSPVVGISDLVGISSAQANTAGGSAFFGGLGLPIVLDVSDGVAVISSSTAPAGAVPSTGLATAAPTAPDTIPTDAAVLSAILSDPIDGASQLLSVSVANGSGSELGSGQVVVPEGGWWVLGLSPQAVTTPPVVDPPVIDPPVIDPPIVDPPVVDPPSPPTAATPEPTTLALAALGLPLAGATRWLRRKGTGKQAPDAR